MNDVTLLAVGVFNECNTRRTIGIVFDFPDCCLHLVLVALEIDDAVLLLVTATDATHGDVSMIVATTALLERLDERLLRRRARDLDKVRDRAKTRCLSDRLELTN